MRRNLFLPFLAVFLAVSHCSAVTAASPRNKIVSVVGIGECTDCASRNINSADALKGLRVAIGCKDGKGKFQVRGTGKLDRNGKFTVRLPSKLLRRDGELREDCFAQLHGGPRNSPCRLAASKITLKYRTGHKHTFSTAMKLTFSSSETCASLTVWNTPFPWLKPIPKFYPPSTPDYAPAPPVYETSPPVTPVYAPPTTVVSPPATPVYTAPPTTVVSPPATPVFTTPPTTVTSPPVTVSTPPVTVSFPPVTVSTPPVTVSTPPVTLTPQPVTLTPQPVTLTPQPVTLTSPTTTPTYTPAPPVATTPATVDLSPPYTYAPAPPVATTPSATFPPFVKTLPPLTFYKPFPPGYGWPPARTNKTPEDTVSSSKP